MCFFFFGNFNSLRGAEALDCVGQSGDRSGTGTETTLNSICLILHVIGESPLSGLASLFLTIFLQNFIKV